MTGLAYSNSPNVPRITPSKAERANYVTVIHSLTIASLAMAPSILGTAFAKRGLNKEEKETKLRGGVARTFFAYGTKLVAGGFVPGPDGTDASQMWNTCKRWESMDTLLDKPRYLEEPGIVHVNHNKRVYHIIDLSVADLTIFKGWADDEIGPEFNKWASGVLEKVSELLQKHGTVSLELFSAFFFVLFVYATATAASTASKTAKNKTKITSILKDASAAGFELLFVCSAYLAANQELITVDEGGNKIYDVIDGIIDHLGFTIEGMKMSMKRFQTKQQEQGKKIEKQGKKIEKQGKEIGELKAGLEAHVVETKSRFAGLKEDLIAFFLSIKVIVMLLNFFGAKVELVGSDLAAHKDSTESRIAANEEVIAANKGELKEEMKQKSNAHARGIYNNKLAIDAVAAVTAANKEETNRRLAGMSEKNIAKCNKDQVDIAKVKAKALNTETALAGLEDKVAGLTEERISAEAGEVDMPTIEDQE